MDQSLRHVGGRGRSIRNVVEDLEYPKGGFVGTYQGYLNVSFNSGR
jgi:hypothetical protein